MTPAIPSRRAVLGTFAALPLAVLPVAASAATADPDAAVVKLADEIAAVHAGSERLSLMEEDLPTFRERDRWSEERVRPLTNRYLYRLQTLAMTPAVGRTGFLAKARVCLIHSTLEAGEANPVHDDAVA